MAIDWATASRAERNAAYDNNGAVADSAQLITVRNAAAKAYRAAHPAGLDVAYGGAPRQKLDLFPAADPAAPCLVFIHGGYWQRNSREDFAHYAAGVRAQGWSVAMPSYSLAPDVSLTVIVGEIHQALDWLASEGRHHGVAAGKIVVSGWSAGSQLAAMALPHSAVTAGLAISGVYELGPLRDTGLNDKLSLSDVEIATLSPLRLPVVPKPLAIVYGSREVPALINDSRSLHWLRSSCHAPGPLIPVAGADHFTILDELAKPGGVLTRAALALCPE
jgi:arylformamidase